MMNLTTVREINKEIDIFNSSATIMNLLLDKHMPDAKKIPLVKHANILSNKAMVEQLVNTQALEIGAYEAILKVKGYIS